MSQRERILFVVLNFNGWRETIPCVAAILKQSYQSFDIFLVENGSKDESLDKLKQFENNDRVIYAKNTDNLGFAGGVNMGIRYALEHNYSHVVLLNNDAVISSSWLESLLGAMKHMRADVVTGLLLLGNGQKIESTGDSLSSWGLPFPRQREEPTKHAKESGFVFGGTAGASLYRTSLFKEVGLFDEAFFAYFEDTDFNFRSQLLGNKAYYEKSAIAYHDHGTTSSKMPGFTVYQTFKNLPLFFWKNIPASLLIPIGVRFMTYYGSLYLRCLARGQFVPATKGIIRSIYYLPYALRQRQIIQSTRRVDIGYLRRIIYWGLPPKNRATLKRVFHI